MADEKRPDPIDYKNFKKYLKKNGVEKAMGYLDALIHVNENIETLFKHFDPKLERYTNSSPHRVKSHLKDFKAQTNYLIKQINDSKILDTPGNEDQLTL
ncbi:hypothetical protein [Dawidia soli]|uniref:Uncharacterized protein n=1 Tax=Dawidia soli TaxID=2782352 RepID=A0AAP2DCZ2_9BACT|nr:hypothetical protein [Dawidia soli]MBT1689881.1 hypothetical protein [Dawidia soli]